MYNTFINHLYYPSATQMIAPDSAIHDGNTSLPLLPSFYDHWMLKKDAAAFINLIIRKAKSVRWTFWASMNACFLGYLIPFRLLNLPCYASYCPELHSYILVKQMWFLFGSFCIIIMCCTILYKMFASARVKQILSRSTFGGAASKTGIIPQVSLAETMIYVLIGMICITNFVYYYNWKFEQASGPAIPKTKWKAAFIASAHCGDLALGLTMLPVSRQSFIVNGLGVSVATAMRFHKVNATLMTIAAIVHGFITLGIYTSYQKYPSNTMAYRYFWIDRPGAWTSWTCGSWTSILGIVAVMILGLIYLFSLSIIRRRFYFFFVALHPYLAMMVIITSALHASTTGYYALPGLFLYAVELIDRILVWQKPKSLGVAKIEKCGYIRLDIPTAYDWAPNQHAYIYIDCISFIGHPFTPAKVTANTATFLIKPHRGFTRHLSTLITEKLTPKLLVRINAPIGCTGHTLNKVKTLVCFSAGSAITGALSMVYAWLENLNNTGKVYLIWVAPSRAHHEIDLIDDLVRSQSERLCMILYAGRQNQTSVLGLDYERQSLIRNRHFDATELLDKVITPSLSHNDVLGGFVAGPEAFYKRVLAAFDDVSSRKKIVTLLHGDGYSF